MRTHWKGLAVIAAAGLCATAALAAAAPATAATAPSVVINEVESSAPNGGPATGSS